MPVRAALMALAATLFLSAIPRAHSSPEASASTAVSELSPNPTETEIRAVRLFLEPLVPVGHKPSDSENQRLAAALAGYEHRPAPDDFSALEQYLGANPDSAWAPAIWFNLGEDFYHTGWYSKALDAWRKAWPMLQGETDLKGKALGDRAAGELAYMLARLGRMEELAKLLDDVKDRVFMGPATEKIAGAREGLWTMRHRPETAFKCGPYALDSILTSTDRSKGGGILVRTAASTTNGCSLAQVADLSRQLGLNYQMAYRSNNAAFIMPAVVNWKAGHYAALLKEEGGLYLLQDPTFGNTTWVSARAMEYEASGYFLVPPGSLPPGWRTVGDAEGARIFGKGSTSDKDTTATTPADKCNCDNGSGSSWSLRGFFQWASSLIGGGQADRPLDPPAYPYNGIRGMAVSAVQLALVGLNIRDNPLGYAPPIGPEVRFIATYNQRDAGQTGNFDYSNLGSKWTFNWVAFVIDFPGTPSSDISIYTDGGGTYPFTGFNSTNQTFAPQIKTQAVLTRTSTNSYTLLQPDGSQTIFSVPDGGSTTRRVFMTQMIDPAGNSLQISYDGSFRVTALTDAIGQITTFSYTNASDPLKVTKVTDPFGRYVVFTYDSSNRLSSITDTIGMTSQFTYNSGDFIQAMTTPYGTTTFQSGGVDPQRWLITTYPDGEQDRVEFLESSVIGVPMNDPGGSVPAGMATTDTYLIYRNTFYWDRNAYSQAPNDYTKAHIFHWLHLSSGVSSSILESEKAPLENRVWYSYDGQSSSIFTGTTASPNAIGRVLDDGTTQLQTLHYNSLGRVTNAVDPAGRSVTSIYASNLVDVLEVRQTTGTNNDLVAKFLYNSQHLPVAIWDAAGQMTTNTYNARGQMLTTTDAKGETTTLTYDGNGYLLSIHGALAGNSDVGSFTYDAVGRVSTSTDMDGYVITYSYDNLDRITNMAYPDGTFEAFTYDKLDRVKAQDRLGRLTQFTYDSLRRLIAVQDPLNRTVSFEYCGCGGLAALIDPLNRSTRWTHDIQGRVTAKQYADGSSIQYNYETTTSRMKSVQDEKGQLRSYTYAVDDHPVLVSYLQAQVATPAVSFTYDPNYNRVVSMQDAIGTTVYTYYPVGVAGALQLASSTGPWANESVTWQYDALGRVANRAINGVPESYAYDVLGRTTNINNALGNFAYDFDGGTRRVLDSFYPNGQSSHYTYFDNLGDRRLQSMTHLAPGASVISRFNYSYNAVSQITNMVQVFGGATNTWVPGYDAADQLLAAQISQGPNVTNYAYSYDPAGNRLLETFSATNQSQYNALNQVVASSDGALGNVSYEWDAEARLTAINSGIARSEFSYDGLGRRSRIVEKTNGVVQSEKRYAWCGAALCEERDATDAVIRRFFAQGFTAGGSNYFYTRDHLGSVREVVDGGGQVQSQYAYDPYGRRSALVENQPAPFAYTGHFYHPASGLFLSPNRFYSSELGRWLSRDPLGESQGANLYAYTGNNPLNRLDPLGLCWLGDAARELWNLAGDKLGSAYNRAYNWTYEEWVYFWSAHGYYRNGKSNEEVLKEQAHEAALKAVEYGEGLLQIISGEASRVPVAGYVHAVSLNTPALIGGGVYLGAEGPLNGELQRMVDSNGAAPTPILNGVQTIGNAVHH